MSELDKYIAKQALTLGKKDTYVQKKTVMRAASEEIKLSGKSYKTLTGSSRLGGHHPSVGLLSDGRHLVTGSPNGILRLWEIESGRELWASPKRHSDLIQDIAVSPTDRYIASGSDDCTVKIWDSNTGGLLYTLYGHSKSVRKISWAYDEKNLVSVSWDGSIIVWNLATQDVLVKCTGKGSTRAVDWSDNGKQLVSDTSNNEVCIWNAKTGKPVHTLKGNSTFVKAVAWSPNGLFIASGSSDGTICIWESQKYSKIFLTNLNRFEIYSLVWSPNSRFLAVCGYGTHIFVLDPTTGKILINFDFSSERLSYSWRLAWSSDTQFLISSHPGDVFKLWEIRGSLVEENHLSTAEVSTSFLPYAAIQLHRLGIYVPLYVINDLLCLIGGGTPEKSHLDFLRKHKLISTLACLNWPVEARLSLVALLTHEISSAAWKPPAYVTSDVLLHRFMIAVNGEEIKPNYTSINFKEIESAIHGILQQIDEGFIMLLELLGPQAVSQNPGILLRLYKLPMQFLLSRNQKKRQLIGTIFRTNIGNITQGSGLGTENAGITVTGNINSLLPSQLALPSIVFQTRHLRRELLYHARIGYQPPSLRPTLLLLDITPPCYGIVESITRLAAHVIANALLEKDISVALVTTGGTGNVYSLETPANCVDIWLQRSLEPFNAQQTFSTVRVMRETLHDGGLEPVVLFLTHAWLALGSLDGISSKCSII